MSNVTGSVQLTAHGIAASSGGLVQAAMALLSLDHPGLANCPNVMANQRMTNSDFTCRTMPPECHLLSKDGNARHKLY